MKKFTKQEILELYGQVTLGEISFSRMVEIMNERVSEAEDVPAELKEGDLVILWDEDKKLAIIGFYGRYSIGGHYDNREWRWKNALKFESKEQYRKLLKGEI